MLTKVLDWVVGREPVSTATGIAAVVTAALGVAAAFGVAITTSQIAALGALAAALAGWFGRSKVRPVETAASRQLGRLGLDVDSAAADDRLRGSVPLALILLLAGLGLALAFLASSCDALFEDDDETDDLGQHVTLIAHQAPLEGVLSDSGGPAGIPAPAGHDYCAQGHDGCGPGYEPGYGCAGHDGCGDDRDGGKQTCFMACYIEVPGLPGGDGQPQLAAGSSPRQLFPPTPEGIRDFVLATIRGGLDMGRLFAETTIRFVENLLIGIA